MAEMGLDAYRFSISWSRLIPNGRGPLNPKGVQYYNNLISELISHGIQPHVTLNNADLPQALEDEYGGWINRKIVKDFTAYANVCFREFGDRVSYWTTVNEPNVFAIGGYDQGVIPPRHCSSPFGVNCTRGDSSTEPYTVVHNILLAHASAARLYKRKYQEKQNGFIGISIYTLGAIPNTNSTEDAMAAQRINDFYIGWIANPLVFGDYPDTMKEIVGSRIPTFTNHESELVRGSFDFLGVIHYTTCYVEDDPGSLVLKQRDFNIDVAAKIKNMEDIFLDSEYPILPSGLQVVLEYIKQVYENPAQFNLGRHIESGISASIYWECAGCSKEWIGYKRVLLMVLPRCAGDTGWLSIRFWLLLCRFG
ncbi:Beta glucosidase 11, putative isoform 3 [Theobroma cacao]|uniref:Beta glucosidase 11, putative isoform 3 n=1 Tax=Theobroma cacao TaxID=3641 RepID=A0A061DRM5_THECC|nr:Beta glucosidase 11, putative isoform 3 [Theobroma cacao]